MPLRGIRRRGCPGALTAERRAALAQVRRRRVGQSHRRGGEGRGPLAGAPDLDGEHEAVEQQALSAAPSPTSNAGLGSRASGHQGTGPPRAEDALRYIKRKGEVPHSLVGGRHLAGFDRWTGGRVRPPHVSYHFLLRHLRRSRAPGRVDRTATPTAPGQLRGIQSAVRHTTVGLPYRPFLTSIDRITFHSHWPSPS